MTTVRKGSAERSNIPHTRLEQEGLIWEQYYEQGRKLGQGAFGKVHLATNKTTGVQWAIKTVNKDKVREFYYWPHWFANAVFLHKNIFCDPPLEPPHLDSCNEGSQHMLLLRNKKRYP